MQPDGVVLPPPALDQDFGLQQRVKDLSLQELVPQFAVEALDVAILPGTARLDIQRPYGAGYVRGIRIDSGMTTHVRASQQLFLSARGLRYDVARCTARSVMAVRQIKSRPRLAGPLYERIASRLVVKTTGVAELECSQHVEAAIRRYMDDYVASVATSVNAAIRSSESASAQEPSQLRLRIKFQTPEMRLIALRGALDPALKSDAARLQKPLLFCVPRARFGQNIGVVLQLLSNDDVSRISSLGPKARRFEAGFGAFVSATH